MGGVTADVDEVWLRGDEYDAVSRDGFRALWAGQVPTIEWLAAGDHGRAVAIQTLREAGRLESDEGGDLVAVHGLTRRITQHRIVHAGGVVHTWCALDAVGIPAALGIDARAETSCPTCEAPITIPLVAGIPADAPVRLWVPSATCHHLVDEFCSAANLFCDERHLEARHGAGAAGRAVTLVEAAELGRRLWGDLDGRAR